MELNVIYNEECIEGMKKLPDHSIDMILCDLPYGTTKNKWDSIIPLEELWKEYERLIKLNGAIVLTAQPPFDKILAMSNIKHFRYEWIWEKTTPTGFLNAKRMPMKAHENILVFYRKLPVYNPQMTTGHPRKVSAAHHRSAYDGSTNYGNHTAKGYDSTERYPRSVITFKTDKQKGQLHPTQKPVALFEYLIRTYTNEGDIVLDNCMGSGTTAVACLNSGRHYIGFELNEEYHQIALNRVESLI